ncbi:glycoside hydrolase family 93 protein [Vararia minispora EC-137]|uniref:Glycoside hydrolase family 93 protein n=1 Tax=Vararia minispora EC-137 TaxID=1314806 RepID=A0ACB8QMN7_9AGAM|nr:glycoside hydrolase family 93 protein [Vararia minispora EC-137]
MGSGTYPRATRLASGALLGVYTAFTNGNTVLTTVRSTDNGATWTQLGSIATEVTATHDLDNPFVLQLPSGRVLAAFRNHDRASATARPTFFRITICQSADDGATWTFLSTAASEANSVNGLWEPFLRNANDGALQLYYSRENNASDQDSLMRISSDGGQTFSSATIISGSELSAARDGMLGVATISGNSLIAVFESEQNGLFTVNSITSSDDGKTWGNRQRVYTPIGISNNAGAPQVVNVGGRLVVSFMTDEDTQLHAWISGANAKLVVSTDGGGTWGGKTTVSAVQSNWPGMVTIDSSSLLYMVDFNGVKATRVTL